MARRAVLDPFSSHRRRSRLPWPGMGEAQLAHRCPAFAKRDMGDVGHRRGRRQGPQRPVGLFFFRLSLLLFQPCREGAAPPRSMLRCRRQPQIVLRISIGSSEPLQRPQHNENIGSRSDGNARDRRSRRAMELGEVPARRRDHHGNSTAVAARCGYLAQPFSAGFALGEPISIHI